MNRPVNRRLVLGGLAASSALAVPRPAIAKNNPKVVIIGGGFGGASAALTLRKIAPNIDVTLIEANKTYTACPFSNLVITGIRDIKKQQFGYDQIAKAGVRVVNGWANFILPDQKTVRLKTRQDFLYDRLIVAPGIDLVWSGTPDTFNIEGYDQKAVEIMPHAWKAGSQTTLLQNQIEAMPDGGTIIMAIPPAPFRCPPGPYERASLIAHYLKIRKPKSKLLILDAQDRFSKQALFEQVWAENYDGLIERVPGADSGQVMRVDTKTRTVHTDFDSFKADVVNIIPPQMSGITARQAGLSDNSGWCPIDALTFESRLASDIHVIGDATIAAPMPKSAFSANLQGKVCAAQVARLLGGHDPIATTLVNTCYSYCDPDNAFSVSGVYHNADGSFRSVPDAGGTSPVGHYPDLRAAEALHAAEWFETITAETFG